MKTFIQTGFVLMALICAAQVQATPHLNDQAQAVKQKALAQSMRTRTTNDNRQTPQILRAGRNSGCTLNIGSQASNTNPGNRFANSRVTPQPQTVIVGAPTVIVCGR